MGGKADYAQIPNFPLHWREIHCPAGPTSPCILGPALLSVSMPLRVSWPFWFLSHTSIAVTAWELYSQTYWTLPRKRVGRLSKVRLVANTSICSLGPRDCRKTAGWGCGWSLDVWIGVSTGERGDLLTLWVGSQSWKRRRNRPRGGVGSPHAAMCQWRMLRSSRILTSRRAFPIVRKACFSRGEARKYCTNGLLAWFITCKYLPREYMDCHLYCCPRTPKILEVGLVLFTCCEVLWIFTKEAPFCPSDICINVLFWEEPRLSALSYWLFP